MAFGLIAANAFSAEIQVSNDESNKGAIFITGPIEKGDYDKLKTVTRHYVTNFVKDFDDDLKFILNSPGGDVEEAIKIGLLFRKSLAQVYVWGNRLYRESDKDAQWIMKHRTKGWAEKYATQNYVIYSDRYKQAVESINNQARRRRRDDFTAPANVMGENYLKEMGT